MTEAMTAEEAKAKRRMEEIREWDRLEKRKDFRVLMSFLMFFGLVGAVCLGGLATFSAQGGVIVSVLTAIVAMVCFVISGMILLVLLEDN